MATYFFVKDNLANYKADGVSIRVSLHDILIMLNSELWLKLEDVLLLYGIVISREFLKCFVKREERKLSRATIVMCEIILGSIMT